jgi:hypothetical protein
MSRMSTDKNDTSDFLRERPGFDLVIAWTKVAPERGTQQVLEYLVRNNLLEGLSLVQFARLVAAFKQVDRTLMRRVIEQLDFRPRGRGAAGFGYHVRSIKAGTVWANKPILQKMIDQTNPALEELLQVLRHTKWARMECTYKALYNHNPRVGALRRILTSKDSRRRLLKWWYFSRFPPIKLL